MENEDLITENSNEELENFDSNEETVEEVQPEAEFENEGQIKRNNPLTSFRNSYKNMTSENRTFSDVISKNNTRTINPNKVADVDSIDVKEDSLQKKESLSDSAKDKATEVAKEGVKKAASAVASKYTGGLGGKAAGELAGKAFDKIAKKGKNKMLLYIMPSVLGLLFILIIVAAVAGALNYEASIKSKLYEYFKTGSFKIEEENYDLTEYLIYEGVCTRGNSIATCQDVNEYRFYDELKKELTDILEEFEEKNNKNDCGNILEYDYAFLVAAITYNRSPNEYFGVGLSYYEYNGYLDKYIEEIRSLAISMLGGDIETEEPLNDGTCFKNDSDILKDAIVKEKGHADNYLALPNEVLNSEARNSIYANIVASATSITELYGQTNTDTITSLAECPGVTVNNIDKETGKIISSKTYSLEDYVAGVISAEMYGDFNTETYKAFAVAVRTYTLNRTNYCANTIKNSSADQNFTENYKPFALQATKATVGQILTYNGKIFSTEYDSWDCKGEKFCSYKKSPTGEIHTLTLSDKYLKRAAGGHGRGMSQLVAADLGEKGLDYKTILYSFYSSGSVISTMGGTTTSDIPKSAADLVNRYYFTYDMLTLYSNNVLFGQCVWYAKHRAMEIIAASNLPEDEKAKRINSVKTTSGNGEDWYASMNGSIFKKYPSSNEIVAGSVISWDGGNTGYGHVAIVESVYRAEDGTIMVVTSEGYRSGYGNCTSSKGGKTWCVVPNESLWTVAKVFTKVQTLNELIYRPKYTFNGTVSLIG